MAKENIYKKAALLIRNKKRSSIRKGLELFYMHILQRPRDSKAWFEYAGALDFLGKEKEAIKAYQKVFTLGSKKLPTEDRPRLYLQTGSTLRNLGELKRSRRILKNGVKHFPSFKAMHLFLALTELSSRKPKNAFKILFKIILTQSHNKSIKEYSRALKWYSENI